MHTKQYFVHTPAGLCLVTEAGGAVTAATFDEEAVRRAAEQGDLPAYDRFPNLRLNPIGTPFQQQVWEGLRGIAAGERLTYGQLAARLGCPRAVRAVASAVARNPIAVLIPCHRIVPAQGGVGQYRWGGERKVLLLEAESEC